jgi:serine/threonine protein kinase
MLTGKYPFHASNHQQLLKRMLHTSFSLPNDLSEGKETVILFLVFIFIIDAKDILRRMLAPDIITRASLDLIIYHPWLQPYRHLLVEQSLPIQQDPTPEVIKKKKKIKPFKQAVLFIFHGPFPPPKKPYQDLSHLGTRESVFARQRQL